MFKRRETGAIWFPLKNQLKIKTSYLYELVTVSIVFQYANKKGRANVDFSRRNMTSFIHRTANF